jgi:phage gp29-like protein
MSKKWGPEKSPDGNPAGQGKALAENGSGKNHFATRFRANDFTRLMRTLPDPDPILRKMGKGIPELREILSDSHLESVWSVRCSTASGEEWFLTAGEEGRREKEAAELLTAQLKSIDIPRVIEEMMEAVAFGYAPLEVIWLADGKYWTVGGIVGKPPEWFEFNSEDTLVFKTNAGGTEELPPNRFLIARHRPSYANPYGVKVFSKCYWPVKFKTAGFQWWTVFVEKYGGAFMYGKYPGNASEQHKEEMLESLDALIANAVAIFPEGSEITIESLANKGSVNSVHKEYIEAANAEISKAVLGQTLTTEIGDKGSYAAAQAHNMVRGDLAAADRYRICQTFNRLSAVWTLYNFGADVAPPRFEFVKDEDLQKDRAGRDKELYAFGWRPRKSYITREYGIPEEDFDLQHESGAETETEPSAAPHAADGSTCGCNTKTNIFQKLYTSLFATKAEKQRRRDARLMKEFKDLMLEAGQEALDGQIENYIDALGNVENFKDARAALDSVYDKNKYGDFAALVDEVRFAGQGLGGTRGKRK